MKKLKLVFWGKQEAGKTSLISSLRGQPFSKDYNETLGPAISKLDDATYVYDLSGDPKFEAVVAPYVKASTVGVICVDLSKPFDQEKDIHHYAQIIKAFSPEARFILVGTKVDLANKEAKEQFKQIECADVVFKDKLMTSSKDLTEVGSLRKAILACQQSPTASFESQRKIDENEDSSSAPSLYADQTSISSDFFWKVVAHPATVAVGGLLMLAGLLALGIGLSCLCPALAPIMAGVGLALAESTALTLVVGGSIAALTGTLATFFNKHATSDLVAGVSGNDSPEEIDDNWDRLHAHTGL